MRLVLSFFGLVALIVGVIFGLGAVASIATGASFVEWTYAVSIGSMVCGLFFLSGRSRPVEESRSVYVTSGIAGSMAWGKLEQQTSVQSPRFNTPSGLSSRTRIEPAASWLRVSSFGWAAIMAGLVTMASLFLTSFL